MVQSTGTVPRRHGPKCETEADGSNCLYDAVGTCGLAGRLGWHPIGPTGRLSATLLERESQPVCLLQPPRLGLARPWPWLNEGLSFLLIQQQL